MNWKAVDATNQGYAYLSHIIDDRRPLHVFLSSANTSRGRSLSFTHFSFLCKVICSRSLDDIINQQDENASALHAYTV